MNPIVLEGPDGAGKTTLAQAIRSACNYTIIHNGPPKKGEDLYSSYMKQLDIVNYGDQLVFDRLHWGEPIYGKLVRGSPAFTVDQAKQLEQRIVKLGGQTVICLPPYEVCFHNWLNTAKDQYVKNVRVFRQIYMAYARILSTSRTAILYDYTRHRPRAFAEALETMRYTEADK